MICCFDWVYKDTAARDEVRTLQFERYGHHESLQTGRQAQLSRTRHVRNFANHNLYSQISIPVMLYSQQVLLPSFLDAFEMENISSRTSACESTR